MGARVQALKQLAHLPLCLLRRLLRRSRTTDTSRALVPSRLLAGGAEVCPRSGIQKDQISEEEGSAGETAEQSGYLSMALLRKLLAKQKADREEVGRKRDALLEKRRGYAKAARDRELARQNGLSDLPPLVAVAIEEVLKTPAPEPAPEPKPHASSEKLVSRLEAIKDRIFRLRAVYAVHLSVDAAMEANRYLVLFQELAQSLNAKDAKAYDRPRINASLSACASPAIHPAQDTQRLVELRWEAMRTPARREPKPPAVCDGLDWLVL